jgi:hypothetical protein
VYPPREIKQMGFGAGERLTIGQLDAMCQ